MPCAGIVPMLRHELPDEEGATVARRPRAAARSRRRRRGSPTRSNLDELHLLRGPPTSRSPSTRATWPAPTWSCCPVPSTSPPTWPGSAPAGWPTRSRPLAGVPRARHLRRLPDARHARSPIPTASRAASRRASPGSGCCRSRPCSSPRRSPSTATSRSRPTCPSRGPRCAASRPRATRSATAARPAARCGRRTGAGDHRPRPARGPRRRRAPRRPPPAAGARGDVRAPRRRRRRPTSTRRCCNASSSADRLQPRFSRSVDAGAMRWPARSIGMAVALGAMAVAVRTGDPGRPRRKSTRDGDGASPLSGPVGGGTVVTVTGRGSCAGGTEVHVLWTGGADSGDAGVGGDDRCRRDGESLRPEGRLWWSRRVVASCRSRSARATLTYVVRRAPTVTGASPLSGPAGGGTVVTMTGSGFLPGGHGGDGGGDRGLVPAEIPASAMTDRCRGTTMSFAMPASPPRVVSPGWSRSSPGKQARVRADVHVRSRSR